MSCFSAELARRNSSPEGRRWIFVPYDQLSERIGPLARQEPGSLGILLVENAWKAARRPYHRQKLALVLANLRHFALEQAARGIAVRHLAADAPYAEVLRRQAAELGELVVMEPAERELRADLQPLVDDGLLRLEPHEGWLTTPDQFRRSTTAGRPWRMDSFYRLVRRESGILMEADRPLGGKYSFDAENRKPWRGEPPAPEPPRFEPDEITEEVGDLVAARFARHPGRLDLRALPATLEDARALWRWALERCLEHFGPYEDAMSQCSRGLFHTRISALLNLHRLLPAEVVNDVAKSDAPLPSREGFIRQVLGWREFVRHVHRETDGFRRVRGESPPKAEAPADGGWSRWTGESWSVRGDPSGVAGAAPSFLDADWPLPPTFWGVRSGLDCLDSVVHDVWEEAYSHHIPRLMVVANLATLLGVRPRELTDWFWAAYADAYDWVVEPNVLGMGTFAVGDLFTTKPYVSGAAYIDRMGDYCRDCRFDPSSTCPITPLYWAFLDRNRERLSGTGRMGLALRNLERRSLERRRSDREVFQAVRRHLERGETLEPRSEEHSSG